VASAVHYPAAIHRTQAYASLGLEAGSLPVSERLAGAICSLPLWPGMTDAEAFRVGEAVHAFAAPAPRSGRFRSTPEASPTPSRSSVEWTSTT
jgi:hypothetical protein